LRARLAAAQQQGQTAASQEQQLKEQLDSEQSAPQMAEKGLHGQLMDEKAKDAALLRHAKAQLKEGKASSQSIVFSSAGALVAIILVAAVAFRVAHQKHKSLGAALRDLDSSKDEHSQLRQLLLQYEEVPGTVGAEESEPSNIADSPVPRESSPTFKLKSSFLRAVGGKNSHKYLPMSCLRRPSLVAKALGA